mgnify:CR=1 FL=1
MLCYPASTIVRSLMNEFYREEIGHDELLLKALNAIGISRAQLFACAPLPGTAMLCNTLSYWARYEPLFFLTTLGVLEGRQASIDSYVIACQKKGLDGKFLDPIARHAGINQKGRHGELTRCMFASLSCIDAAQARRIRSLTRLFVALYDQFYSDIWSHYGSERPLLRSVDDA